MGISDGESGPLYGYHGRNSLNAPCPGQFGAIVDINLQEYGRVVVLRVMATGLSRRQCGYQVPENPAIMFDWFVGLVPSVGAIRWWILAPILSACLYIHWQHIPDAGPVVRKDDRLGW